MNVFCPGAPSRVLIAPPTVRRNPSSIIANCAPQIEKLDVFLIPGSRLEGVLFDVPDHLWPGYRYIWRLYGPYHNLIEAKPIRGAC